MSKTKKEKDRDRVRLKRENETPEEKLERLEKAKAYRMSAAGKKSRQKYD